MNWRLPLNIWDRIHRLPPCAVRLLAKKGNRLPLAQQAMSDEDVAEAAGLTVATVRLISRRTDWNGVELYVARDFLRACRCDPDSRADMARIRDYLSGAPKWKYLKHSPHFISTFKPLQKLYASIVTIR